MQDWDDHAYRATERRRYETIRLEFPGLVKRAIECRLGWYDIVQSFFEAVASVLPADRGGEFVLLQIKEKLGGLRIYYHLSKGLDPAIRAAIWKARMVAEDVSLETCEVCGHPGVLRMRDGWYATRCPLHADHAEPCQLEGDS